MGVTGLFQGCHRNVTVQARRFRGREECGQEAREAHEGQRERQEPKMMEIKKPMNEILVCNRLDL